MGIGRVANPEVGDQHTLEPDRTDYLPLERACNRRLAPAGIGPKQQPVLTPTDTPRLPAREGGQQRRDGSNDQPRDAGWQIVHDVIEPCTTPAKSEVAWRLVADHRIHGA